MTKAVRIENADTAPGKIVVETWDVVAGGEPPELVSTQTLEWPTAMAQLTLYGNRFFIVKKAGGPSE